VDEDSYPGLNGAVGLFMPWINIQCVNDMTMGDRQPKCHAVVYCAAGEDFMVHSLAKPMAGSLVTEAQCSPYSDFKKPFEPMPGLLRSDPPVRLVRQPESIEELMNRWSSYVAENESFTGNLGVFQGYEMFRIIPGYGTPTPGNASYLRSMFMYDSGRIAWKMTYDANVPDVALTLLGPHSYDDNGDFVPPTGAHFVDTSISLTKLDTWSILEVEVPLLGPYPVRENPLLFGDVDSVFWPRYEWGCGFTTPLHAEFAEAVWQKPGTNFQLFFLMPPIGPGRCVWNQNKRPESLSKPKQKDKKKTKVQTPDFLKI